MLLTAIWLSHPRESTDRMNVRPAKMSKFEAVALAYQSSFFYLTTIGVFSAGAEGAIEKINQVFQPDDRF
jgi:hypothetical protein